MTAPDRRAEFIAGLRELADFFEQHPDMPVLRRPELSHCVTGEEDDAAGIAEIELIAGILGVTAIVDNGSADVGRQFRGLRFRAFHVSRQRSEEWDAFVSYHGSVKPGDGA